MSKDGEFVSDVTEFPRTSPEEDSRSSYGFLGFSKLFSFGGRTNETPDLVTAPEPSPVQEKGESSVAETLSNHAAEGRSLPNVLKRISNLVAGKEGLMPYNSTMLKQYWMPDSFSKECYHCGMKFTTFRRRHHCRICGQIFCSNCCNQRIPGKIMGCVGDLRVCMYCCSLVLSYMESSDISAEIKADLQTIQEDLRRDYDNQQSTAVPPVLSAQKRKPSVGYQEDRFVLGQAPSCPVLSDEERCQALQNSTSLRAMFKEILDPVTGIPLKNVTYRNQTIPDCLTGSELVNWSIANSKAATRVQALAMGQMLLEAGYLEPTTEFSFVDGESSYRAIPSLISIPQQPANASWGQNTDSESERLSEGEEEAGLPQSGSSYLLDMNMDDRVVHVAKPPASTSEPQSSSTPRRKKASVAQEASILLDLHSQHDPYDVVLKSGWYRAENLVRAVNGEAEAYYRFSSAFDTHEGKLLSQLLTNEGLSGSWADVITPVARTVVNQIQPDYRQNDEMDIRLYAKIKKLPGGSLDDLKIISGVVFSKNVAHRAMRSNIEEPRILLLQCAIVYERAEDRILSLEPVMMQEHEYLRHVVARIASLRPDVVLVHKNVSRLAQEYLLQLGITLVLNVKISVMERIARFTGADIVKRVDAHVGLLKLGSCKRFYIDTYSLENGVKKTLMIFEGPQNPKVGCTILLRGGSSAEFSKLKKIFSFIILAEYNWRLEKSFLMDEFAKPPAPPAELFQESPTGSPDYQKVVCETSDVKSGYEESLEDDAQCTFDGEEPVKQTITVCSHPAKSLEINDPLQADHNDPIWSQRSENVQLAVAELPRGNKFRTALDGTILSISPFLKLGVPYLESESGRNCQLRSYFPDTIYYSKHLRNKKQEREVRSSVKINKEDDFTDYLLPMHEMLITKLTDDVSDPNVQALVALFRANGGRIPLGLKLNLKRKKPTVEATKYRDVFDAFEHQRFPVLFCCYSSHSENAPAFCVDPWVVSMVSYGPNDIPLGLFLESFCFRPQDSCQSQTCRASLKQHVRRFVHDSGVLCLTLGTTPKESVTDKIRLWNWCAVCQNASPIVPMSADTWCLSFAKYLELRFLGDSYTLRGSETCRHNLHHEHYQCFAKGDTMAVFKYSPITNRWEISLPPSLISLVPAANTQAAVDELRLVSIKGHDVFSSILEHLLGIDAVPEEETTALKQQIQKEHANFKSHIEEIQYRLTSPSLENKTFDPHQAIRETSAALWRIEDAIVTLKRQICEAVYSWNLRFLEIRKKDDRVKRFSDGNVKSQISPPQSEDGRSRDEDVNSTCDTEDEPVWDKFGDGIDSEDNLSVTSHQEDGRSLDDGLREKRSDLKDKSDESHTDSKSDKKSVKTIISQILAPNKESSPIQCPWPPQEHYLLPPGAVANIVVLEAEPSSIISFGLASHEHQRHLEEKRSALSLPATDSSTPSPIHRKKPLNSTSSAEKETDPASSPHHFEVNFSDSTANFSCKVYYAEFFYNLRSLIFPAGEEAFIRSLARCVPWAARGGKSGSNFCKTKDDRFVLKQITKLELTLFLEFAPQYSKYVTKCHEDELPTLLGKILGVFTVSCRNSSGVVKSNFLVMENLFYLRADMEKYDLKGSVRNRLVNPMGCRDPDIVYMDENLLKMTCEKPLYILPHSQTILMLAIERDTTFLAGQEVMDYSLLVGLDKDRSELVIGIIDYIRTFTWDKRLENIMKTSVSKLQPTIIQPKDYRERFVAAMKRYFLPVPDRWYGFEKEFS